MSFIRNRGVSRGTLGGLGVLGRRSLGRGGPEVRLQDSLSWHPFSLSGSDTPPELFPIVHLGNGIEFCSCRSAGEGSTRASSFFPPGYYSRLFVTPKVTGGWRPVIDLSCLNRSVLVSHFHMETAQSVLQSLRPGDWMVSLDLQWPPWCSG